MRKKENVEERLKQLYSRSQRAPTNSVKDKSNSVVRQKKNFVAEFFFFFFFFSRIYLSRIVEKVLKNLSSYAPDQDEGNKQQCN